MVTVTYGPPEKLRSPGLNPIGVVAVTPTTHRRRVVSESTAPEANSAVTVTVVVACVLGDGGLLPGVGAGVHFQVDGGGGGVVVGDGDPGADRLPEHRSHELDLFGGHLVYGVVGGG